MKHRTIPDNPCGRYWMVGEYVTRAGSETISDKIINFQTIYRFFCHTFDTQEGRGRVGDSDSVRHFARVFTRVFGSTRIYEQSAIPSDESPGLQPRQLTYVYIVVKPSVSDIRWQSLRLTKHLNLIAFESGLVSGRSRYYRRTGDNHFSCGRLRALPIPGHTDIVTDICLLKV